MHYDVNLEMRYFLPMLALCISSTLTPLSAPFFFKSLYHQHQTMALTPYPYSKPVPQNQLLTMVQWKQCSISPHAIQCKKKTARPEGGHPSIRDPWRPYHLCKEKQSTTSKSKTSPRNGYSTTTECQHARTLEQKGALHVPIHFTKPTSKLTMWQELIRVPVQSYNKNDAPPFLSILQFFRHTWQLFWHFSKHQRALGSRSPIRPQH